jgi:hypothetical protein
MTFDTANPLLVGIALSGHDGVRTDHHSGLRDCSPYSWLLDKGIDFAPRNVRPFSAAFEILIPANGLCRQRQQRLTSNHCSRAACHTHVWLCKIKAENLFPQPLIFLTTSR